jgi:hypothetical protein
MDSPLKGYYVGYTVNLEGRKTIRRDTTGIARSF